MRQTRYRAIFWCRIGRKKSIRKTSFKTLKYIHQKYKKLEKY